MSAKTVTCSFVVDRELYNNYKSIVIKNNQNVKGNLIRYMQDVVASEIPNRKSIETVNEAAEAKTSSMKSAVSNKNRNK